MSRLKITLLLFPFITEIILSCTSCNCEEPQPQPYYQCSISLDNVDYSSSGTPAITHADTIPKDDYGISLIINRQENICQRPTPSNSSFSFFSSAYACSCIQNNEFYANATVTDIEIFSVNAFDGTHPANSNVSDYIMVDDNGDIITIATYVNQMESVIYSNSGYFDSSSSRIYLQFQNAPTLGTSHQFEVHVKLSDGQVLSAQTVPVTLI